MINLVKMLKRHEGLRLKTYRDTVGKLTVGYGRNLDDNGISADEAEYMLENDVMAAEGALSINLPWYSDLDEVRRDVLTDMCFNLGWSKLSKFIKTLGYIQAGQYDAAAKAMLQSKWAHQVGKRADELSEMMRTGAYKA